MNSTTYRAVGINRRTSAPAGDPFGWRQRDELDDVPRRGDQSSDLGTRWWSAPTVKMARGARRCATGLESAGNLELHQSQDERSWSLTNCRAGCRCARSPRGWAAASL